MLQVLGWVINFQKSSPQPSLCQGCLGLILDRSEAKVFSPEKKLLSLIAQACNLSKRFWMNVQVLMVASFEAAFLCILSYNGNYLHTRFVTHQVFSFNLRVRGVNST